MFVGQVSHEALPGYYNRDYLTAKRDRLGTPCNGLADHHTTSTGRGIPAPEPIPRSEAISPIMIRGCWPGESRPRPGGGPVFGWARQQALQRGFDDITIGCEPTGHRCGILDQLAAQRVPTTRLNAEAAAQVATTLQPLATPSRLLILTELRQAPAR